MLSLLFDFLKNEFHGKIFWTLHDCWSFTGHCPHFIRVGCDRWQTGCFSCPLKRDYPASNLFDRSKENYAKKKAVFTGVRNLTILAPSKWLASCVGKSYLNEYPVKVSPNGIDLMVFKPTIGDFREKHHIADGQKIILGVAFGWDERKRTRCIYQSC